MKYKANNTRRIIEFLLIIFFFSFCELSYSQPEQNNNVLVPTPTPIPTETPSCIPEAVIKEILNETCQEPYSCYQNCTSFTCHFEDLCQSLGNPDLCKAGNITCSNPSKTHSVPLIYVCERKEWCIYSAQNGSLIGCAVRPYAMTDHTLCKAMSREYPCDCPYESYEVLEDETKNSNPYYCAWNNSSFPECTACCERFNNRNCKSNDPLAKQWFDDCIGSCENYFPCNKYTPRPTPTPCSNT